MPVPIKEDPTEVHPEHEFYIEHVDSGLLLSLNNKKVPLKSQIQLGSSKAGEYKKFIFTEDGTI